MSTVPTIPIFVLSHNDWASLRLCLRSLRRRTIHPHKLVVVDNASTDARVRRYLSKIAAFTGILVHHNRWNGWVLGLNAPLHKQLQMAPAKYFAVTDCDIVPPIPDARGICWLSRLVALMESHVAVGKLGLALDLGYLVNRPEFQETLRRERAIQSGPILGDVIVASVDTTLAIYRTDVFVTDRPWFLPGHQSLYRPYYYCCRTASDFRAKHLSWRHYRSQSPQDMRSKWWCFTVCGAALDPVFLGRVGRWRRWIYQLLRPLMRVVWGSLGFVLHLRYFVRSMPRDFNRVQSARRL